MRMNLCWPIALDNEAYVVPDNNERWKSRRPTADAHSHSRWQNVQCVKSPRVLEIKLFSATADDMLF